MWWAMDFDSLVDSYEKTIYNLVYRLLGDREEAADVTQETFVAAYRSWGSFREESAVYTWLYRIAVNLCKNRFRDRDRRREHEWLSLDDPGPHLSGGSDTYMDEKPTPEALIERKELKEMIEQAISQLPLDYRIVAVLRDLQGLSYADIAVAAEVSVDVVKTRLARARGMLRKRLGAYLEG